MAENDLYLSTITTPLGWKPEIYTHTFSLSLFSLTLRHTNRCIEISCD